MNAEQIYTLEFDLIAIWLRYLLIAGMAYLILYKLEPKRFLKFRIKKPKNSRGDLKRELFYSILTLVIYSFTSWSIFLLYENGYTLLYPDLYEYGIFYLLFSFVVCIMIHDTYFYWTHRLIHRKKLYAYIHKTHHLSTHPTPLAAFAFHPFEGILSVGIILLLAFTIPLHPFVLFSFLNFMTVMNVIGHLGFEFFPLSWKKKKYLRWINCCSNHDAHHSTGKSNYGLYFTWWDHWMGTSGEKEITMNDRAS